MKEYKLDIRVTDTIEFDKNTLRTIEATSGKPIEEALKEIARSQILDADGDDPDKIDVEISEK